MGVALNQNEKKACPSLHLHNSASRLNSFIIQNHRLIAKEQKKLESKNNNLLTGLGIEKKIIKKIVKVEQITKSRDHADTQLLRMILKMIPIEPINAHNFSKILRTSERLTIDGCNFLLDLKLIHSSGRNRYRANECF